MDAPHTTGQQDGAAGPAMDIEAAYKTLDYLLSGLAFGDPRERIQAIGQELHEAGGKALMLEVAHRLQRSDELAASRLDGMWSGIGDWF